MYLRKPSFGAPVSLPSPLSITRIYIYYDQTINIIGSFAFSPPDLIYVLPRLRMHFRDSKVLWTALKVFPTKSSLGADKF